MKKILICGAGGFIGGHLASRYINDPNYQLICVDIKPKEYWFQIFDNAENYSLDLKDYNNTLKVTKGVDYIFNLACNMGGMGFIENNKIKYHKNYYFFLYRLKEINFFLSINKY